MFLRLQSRKGITMFDSFRFLKRAGDRNVGIASGPNRGGGLCLPPPTGLRSPRGQDAAVGRRLLSPAVSGRQPRPNSESLSSLPLAAQHAVSIGNRSGPVCLSCGIGCGGRELGQPGQRLHRPSAVGGFAGLRRIGHLGHVAGRAGLWRGGAAGGDREDLGQQQPRGFELWDNRRVVRQRPGRIGTRL